MAQAYASRPAEKLGPQSDSERLPEVSSQGRGFEHLEQLEQSEDLDFLLVYLHSTRPKTKCNARAFTGLIACVEGPWLCKPNIDPGMQAFLQMVQGSRCA